MDAKRLPVDAHRRGFAEVRAFSAGWTVRVGALALTWQRDAMWAGVRVEWLRATYRLVGGRLLLGRG